MPSNGSTTASMLAHLSWAKTKNRSDRTAPARRALDEKLAQEVDPDGEMSPADRVAAVANYRAAYYRRLAMASAAARRAKRDAGTTEAGPVAA